LRNFDHSAIGYDSQKVCDFRLMMEPVNSEITSRRYQMFDLGFDFRLVECRGSIESSVGKLPFIQP